MAATELPSQSEGVKKGLTAGIGEQRVGHVFLDVRQRRLHCLNEEARRLHREGVPLAASDLLGHPLHNLDGRPITAVEMPLAIAWRTGKPVEEQYLLVALCPPPRQVRWTASPLGDTRGQLLGIVGTVICAPSGPDLRKLAELAHDLRTPLQSLKLLSSLLERLPQVDAEARDNLKTLRWSADRAVKIALDLLEQCRAPAKTETASPLRWFGLQELLVDLAREHGVTASTKGLSLVSELAPSEGWEVQSDPGRLSRVLSNLLVNAIRYTPRGRIEFTVAWREDNGGRCLVISVIDTGPGISEEEQEWVFHAFERGKAGKENDSSGSGLGLAVVDRLVGELGLTLDVFSEYGRGSAFHLQIPPGLLRPVPANAAGGN
jgi:anti-sigma regulatory factor (Ser/Thr protein kinase)